MFTSYYFLICWICHERTYEGLPNGVWLSYTWPNHKGSQNLSWNAKKFCGHLSVYLLVISSKQPHYIGLYGTYHLSSLIGVQKREYAREILYKRRICQLCVVLAGEMPPGWRPPQPAVKTRTSHGIVVSPLSFRIVAPRFPGLSL